LHEDVLFYLFYNCPGEVYQVAAASELYARDWRFHKIERLWFQRAAFFAPPKEIGGTFERCQYNAFDPILWRKVPKEMVLEFKDLEGKPTKQLKRISSGLTLHRAEARHLTSVLQENPELFSHSSEQLLDFIQYEPELAGILLVYQLLYEPSNYRSSVEILLNMN
uniref:NOT2/NOT3/NOT5 C-terminal domain-containing protein n=1 Tax=Meloidogyne javanica TaxID=6303 RepID=A0A915MVL2_MELJA